MPNFIKVDTATNRVVGWQRGKTIPPAPAGMRHVERTDAEMQAYHDLRKQASADGRSGDITETGGTVSLKQDSRPFLDVTANKTEIDADGVEEVTLTFQYLEADGRPNTTFAGVVRAPLFNGEYLVKLSFVLGVAVKALAISKSGEYSIDSRVEYKIKTPLTVTAYA